MNEKTLAKVNRFGKIGKLVMTLLLIAALILTALTGAAAIYTAMLPKDVVTVTVTNHAEFKIDDAFFPSVWEMLNDSTTYATDSDPSSAWKDDADGILLPPEDTELNTRLHFFHQTYSTATVHTDVNKTTIDTASSPAKYHSSDLTALLLFSALFTASVAAALLMLRKLFQTLSVCASPFCMEFVSRLRSFGFSLLPVAAFASVGETLAVRFLSAGKTNGISIQWGVLIAFAVTMCLVTVFRYGVQLQKESDETL